MRIRLLSTALLALALPALAGSPAPVGDGWETAYELSGGLESAPYAETQAFCRRLADASPWIRYESFGRSPQGRDLMLLVVDKAGRFTPGAVHASDDAVLMLQAGIHAGEICGKEAGLMLLRDLAIRGEHPELLDGVVLLFLPVFNVDGHERRGPLNRANQNGPLEMGWRATAQGYNLNRDFVKADAPEMQAWLRLYDAWLPDLFVDSHVTDGADFQPVMLIDVPTRGNLDPGLAAWVRDRLGAALDADFAAAGQLLMAYGDFRTWNDPRSGLELFVSGPRYSHGYCAERNRAGMLLEAHVFKTFRERVEATYTAFAASLRAVGADHARLRALGEAADRRAAALAGDDAELPLRFAVDPGDSVLVDFLGYDYEFVESPLTGGSYPVFHPDRPAVWRIPRFEKALPSVTARVPDAYLIPAEWSPVIDRLALHGVTVRRLAAAVELPVERVRFRDVVWSEAPYEGRHTLDYAADPLHETRRWPAGTAVVLMDQPAARIAVHALDPAGPDALVRWGLFDTIFERKEYVEPYVLEPELPALLAAHPGLREEYEAELEAAPELRGNYWGRILWFYRRSPWWDDRIDAYPVGWTHDEAAVAGLPLE